MGQGKTLPIVCIKRLDFERAAVGCESRVTLPSVIVPSTSMRSS